MKSKQTSLPENSLTNKFESIYVHIECHNFVRASVAMSNNFFCFFDVVLALPNAISKKK